MTSTRKEYSQKLEKITHSIIDLLDDTTKMVEILFHTVESSEVPIQQAKELDDMVRSKTKQLLDLCTEVVTLQQPMATDVRLILSAIRIKTDIERSVRDSYHIIQFQLAESINAEYKSALENTRSVFFEMINILKESITTNNPELLIKLNDKDEIIDNYYDKTNQQIRNEIAAHPENAGKLIDLLLTTRMIERIADHFCNIGEKVYYIQTAESIRAICACCCIDR